MCPLRDDKLVNFATTVKDVTDSISVRLIRSLQSCVVLLPLVVLLMLQLELLVKMDL